MKENTALVSPSSQPIKSPKQNFSKGKTITQTLKVLSGEIEMLSASSKKSRRKI